MKIAEILLPENTLYDEQADSKKAVIEIISKLMAKNLPDIEYDEIFDGLIAREKLGSTSVGHGVAIPHCRIDTITEPTGAFIHLQKPIDFAAIDNTSVDLFFVLLVPKEDIDLCLDILATLAKKFSSKELRNKLRTAKDNAELYKIVTEI